MKREKKTRRHLPLPLHSESNLLFVEVDAVMVLTTGVTTATTMLSVLAYQQKIAEKPETRPQNATYRHDHNPW